MTSRIDGWKQIAAYLQRSERWCKDMSSVERGLDMRLPVWHLGGRVYSTAPELDAWVAEAKRLEAKRMGDEMLAFNRAQMGKDGQ